MPTALAALLVAADVGGGVALALVAVAYVRARRELQRLREEVYEDSLRPCWGCSRRRDCL